MAKKVMVIGATGLVGSYIMDYYKYASDVDICGTCYSKKVLGYPQLQLEEFSDVWNLFATFKPNLVYVPAYISNVDKCEYEPTARKINIDGIFNLVDVAEKFNSKLVFFSSAYVFDGSKHKPYEVFDNPMPIQQYGLQKLICENRVLANSKNVVVRTSNVFGKETYRKNFAYQVHDGLVKNRTFQAYDDQLVAPIHAEDLSVSAVQVVEDGMQGLVHINGNEEVSKYEFALDICRLFFPFDAQYKIERVTSKSRPQPAKRPYNACLKNTIDNDFSYLFMLEKFYADN